VSEGSQVEFTVPSLPGEVFKGEVTFLDPVMNAQSRVVKARGVVENKGGKLKPEMLVNAVVYAGDDQPQEQLSVPKSAVLWTGKRSVVYVKTADEQGVYFRMREVDLGPAVGDSYAVESGLEKGEEIAVHGAFSVDAAAQLASKPSMMSGSMESSSDFRLSGIISDKLEGMIENYLALKNALVNDDFAKAQSEASAMSDSFEENPQNEFPQEPREEWSRLADKLSKSVKTTESASDIENMRKHFQPLSDGMIHLARKFKSVSDTLYVQHCPMADNNNGADWLSSEDKVLNPYFGSAMLSCGEVTDEIK
jgi:Cu(I)/Ag(I) efflux system membrane fusion protein